ncbi:hypothetical protein Leryth_023006 [Lithospermum erythrorhizon]|nr:hypothetical protein Leryth_023006 [Lithospermum erythrorhizon]
MPHTMVLKKFLKQVSFLMLLTREGRVFLLDHLYTR